MIKYKIKEKHGYYHMIAEFMDPITGKLKTKSKSTGLKVKTESARENKQNKKEAYLMLADFKKEVKENYGKEEKETEEVMFNDYLKSWYESVKGNLRANTIVSYNKIIFNKIIPYFEGVLLNDLTTEKIQKYYTDSRNNGLSGNTVLKHHAIIRKALQAAYKTGKVLRNEADLVTKPKKERYTPSVLNAEDEKLFREEIQGTPFFIPATLSLLLGLRRSESLGLLWKNIDFEKNEITIENTAVEVEAKKKNKKLEVKIQKATKNKTSRRVLHIPEELKEVLLQIKEQQEEYKNRFKGAYNKKYLDFVCVKENGDLITPGYVTQHFKLVVRKLGLDKELTYHSLRHTFATKLYKKTGDIIVVQHSLGHSTVSTTADIYLHLTKEIYTEKCRDVLGEVTREYLGSEDGNKKNHTFKIKPPQERK